MRCVWLIRYTGRLRGVAQSCHIEEVALVYVWKESRCCEEGGGGWRRDREGNRMRTIIN